MSLKLAQYGIAELIVQETVLRALRGVEGFLLPSAEDFLS